MMRKVISFPLGSLRCLPEGSYPVEGKELLQEAASQGSTTVPVFLPLLLGSLNFKKNLHCREGEGVKSGLNRGLGPIVFVSPDRVLLRWGMINSEVRRRVYPGAHT